MKKTIIQDLLAGLTVSFAALSLGAAFGIMSGRGAFAGMLGAAIIPIITSIFGGTRLQASGPTAPMTAITALIVAKAYDSYEGNAHIADQYITLVLIMASLFIVLTGVFKLGKLIQKVPQIVLLGFMNGIALLIWFDQIKLLFGLNHQKRLEGDLFVNVTLVLTTLLLIYAIPFGLKKFKVPLAVRRFIPSIFVTILLITLFTNYFKLNVQHVNLGETYSNFSDYLNIVVKHLPFNSEMLNLDILMSAVPLALQLCLLSYLDSLLTSLVIDKMTKEKTKPNKELMAQGLANGISGLLQGIPGAQATIRSVLLIKEGAKTRWAGVFVGLFALLGFLVFGSFISLITSAVFVGILLKAGSDVLDRDFPIAYFKHKWYRNKQRNIQFGFIIYTTLITVFVDLNSAVISATLFYYLGKKIFKFEDCEDDFSMVESEDLMGAVSENKDFELSKSLN